MVEGDTRGARVDRKGVTYRPRWRPAGWTGRRHRLGDNKEVFDVEVCICHILTRSEDNTAHTVFLDSTAALSRAQTDRTGPGQALPRATIETRDSRLEARGCSIALRWSPAHRGVEGNEVADEYAKVAAECMGPTCGTCGRLASPS